MKHPFFTKTAKNTEFLRTHILGPDTFNGLTLSQRVRELEAREKKKMRFKLDMADADGVLDAADNCPDLANADQLDSNGNGIGDACDSASNENPPNPLYQGGSNFTSPDDSG